MAAVNDARSYDFEMFEARAYVRNTGVSAAPKRTEKEDVPLRKISPDTSRRQRRQAVKTLRTGVTITLVAAIMLGVLCLQISAGAKRYELSRQISRIENEISIAKSENVRLSAQLSGYTSIGKIDDYATKILGMTKLESYQVEYIDLSEDDGVIYTSSSGGLLSIFSGN